MYFLICHAHVEKDTKPSPTFSYCKYQKVGLGPGNEANDRWQLTHFLWRQLDIRIIIHVIYMYVYWPIEDIANARAQELIQCWSPCLQHPVCNILSCGLLYIARSLCGFIQAIQLSLVLSSTACWQTYPSAEHYWCFQTQTVNSVFRMNWDSSEEQRIHIYCFRARLRVVLYTSS